MTTGPAVARAFEVTQHRFFQPSIVIPEEETYLDLGLVFGPRFPQSDGGGGSGAHEPTRLELAFQLQQDATWWALRDSPGVPFMAHLCSFLSDWYVFEIQIGRDPHERVPRELTLRAGDCGGCGDGHGIPWNRTIDGQVIVACASCGQDLGRDDGTDRWEQKRFRRVDGVEARPEDAYLGYRIDFGPRFAKRDELPRREFIAQLHRQSLSWERRQAPGAPFMAGLLALCRDWQILQLESGAPDAPVPVRSDLTSGACNTCGAGEMWWIEDDSTPDTPPTGSLSGSIHMMADACSACTSKEIP